jgi:hypothetical protein
MPSSDRFVSSEEGMGQRLRRHPLALAGIAAFCGALLSALLVGAVMRPGAPAKPSKVEAARSIPETTGSAARSAARTDAQPPAKVEAAKAEPAPAKTEPAKTEPVAPPSEQTATADSTKNSNAATEKSAAADCQEQTWPYIARPCLAGEVPQRGVRVISTDRLADPVISAVEQPPEAVVNRATPAPVPAPKVAATPPEQKFEPAKPIETAKPAEAAKPIEVAKPSEAAKPVETARPSEAAKPEPARPVEVATTPPTTPAPATTAPAATITPTPTVATTPPASVQPAMADPTPAAAPPKREAKKQRSRKSKSKRESADEEVVETTGSGGGREVREYREVRDGRDYRDVRESRDGVRGRIVERWTEKEYTVPSSSGGQRRVIVIERGGSEGGRGGLFGNLFGGGGEVRSSFRD